MKITYAIFAEGIRSFYKISYEIAIYEKANVCINAQKAVWDSPVPITL